jgi:dTDP-4-dehydrorhamnose reductase
MRKPKILVFGRVGQVGWELRHKLACLGDVTSVDYPEIDFSKPATIRAAVRAAEPTVIVNAAAYTAVDKAEAQPEPAWAINAIGPGVIAEEARRLGALMVHYSTDYVYDGSKAGPWVETDVPNPLNVYGKTKLAGDEAIAAVGGDYLILRTSWVYGARGANFLLTMLRLAKERPELRIVDDQTGSPTTSECIAQATAQILTQVVAPGRGGSGNVLGGRSGVYHLTSAGATTWFGFAKQFLSRRGDACPNLTPIPSSEYPVPASRPVNSVLSCERLAETFGVQMPAWEVALELVLETLAESAGKP